jgi:peptidyl-prolyl cis-trans isomerase D
MLQALRDKSSGWITIVILGFLAFLLLLSGLGGYQVSTTDTSAAKVGSDEITTAEFGVRYEQKRSQFLQTGQDSAAFDTAERRREVLDEVVGEKLLEQAANDSGVVFSLQSIREIIAKDPNFQKDGKLDNATFLSLLAANQMTEAQYVQRLTEALRKSALRSAVGASALVSERDIDQFLKIRDQTRNFRFITLDVNDLAAPVVPTEAELKTAFDANKSSYMTTEYADFEYVRVQASTLPKAVATEIVLKKRYDDQAARFKTAERRQAAHILIEVDGGANAPVDKQKAALLVANGLLERARKGEDFAELARVNSKDLGSANQGGDLGFLEKGTSEPAFEAKLYSMKVGEISDPVLTSQGYHIIKIGEIEAERVKTFAEARADLESEFITQESDAAFNKVSGAMVDAAISDPRSLAAAAKVTGMQPLRTGMISAIGQPESGVPAPGGLDFASKPELLKTAFTSAVLDRGVNSELITLSPGDVVILRLAQRKASSLKPFESVRGNVLIALNAERQALALKARAAAVLKLMTDGKTFDVAALEQKKTIEVADKAGRNAANRDPVLSQEAFKAARPTAGRPTRFSAVLSPDRVVIVELTGVTDADPKIADKATRDSVRQQLSYEVAESELAGLKASLMRNSNVVLHEERLGQ